MKEGERTNSKIQYFFFYIVGERVGKKSLTIVNIFPPVNLDQYNLKVIYSVTTGENKTFKYYMF